MNYRMMFMINAIASALLGAVLLLMPEFVLVQLGSETYVSTQLIVRFFGGTLLVSGVLLWFLKDVAVKIQKGAGFALLAGSVGGFALSIIGMTAAGIFRSNGWVLLVIFGVFSLVYGYLLFLQPKQSDSKARAPRKVKETPSANSGQSI